MVLPVSLVHFLLIYPYLHGRKSHVILSVFMQVYCQGRRDYNSSFKVDTQVVEAVSSRRTIIKKEVVRPGTKYSVYVKAATRNGDGVQSDPAVLETPSEGMRESWFSSM